MFGYGVVLTGYNSWLLFTGAQQGEQIFDPVRSFSMPLYLLLLALFHMVEFLFVVCFHPSNVSFMSFLIVPDQHGAYSLAMGVAMLEFWGRDALLDYLGEHVGTWGCWIVVPGLLIALGGWVVRCLALFTAQSNFTHQIAYRKTGTHTLVMHGIYSCCRHPSYLGWFIFCTATQIVLLNPICYFLYFAAAWRFFAARIPVEEALLLDFFGNEFADYACRVPAGLPWMSELEQWSRQGPTRSM